MTLSGTGSLMMCGMRQNERTVFFDRFDGHTNEAVDQLKDRPPEA